MFHKKSHMAGFPIDRHTCRAIQRRNNAFKRAKQSGSGTNLKPWEIKRLQCCGTRNNFFLNGHVNSPDKKQFGRLWKRWERINVLAQSYVWMALMQLQMWTNLICWMHISRVASIRPYLPWITPHVSLCLIVSLSVLSHLCSEEEVLHLLETIDISESNGPDRISGWMMLKSTAASIAAPVNQAVQPVEHFPTNES